MVVVRERNLLKTDLVKSELQVDSSVLEGGLSNVDCIFKILKATDANSVSQISIAYLWTILKHFGGLKSTKLKE